MKHCRTALYERIKRLSGNPKLLYWVFSGILMMANAVLFFTEPLSLPMRIAYIGLPLGVQTALLALPRKPGKMFLLLLPKHVLDAFQLVLVSLFGGSVIAVDMFINVVSTNANEAGELLTNLWPVILFLVAVYIPAFALAVLSLRQPETLPERFRKKMLRTAAVLFAAGLGGFAWAKCIPEGGSLRDDLYPANALYNLKFAISKTHRVAEYPRTSAGFTFGATRAATAGTGTPDAAGTAAFPGSAAADSTAADSGREVYLLLLGETARAQSWSLYGYGRATTPRLDTLSGLVVLRDALTQSNTTHKSLSLILSPAEAADYERIYTAKSLITAFKEARFKTVFITNQLYNKSFTSYFFQEADERHSLAEQNSERKHDDHDLLPLLEQVLERETGDLLIILHLYGSHFNYAERYADRFRTFEPDMPRKISRAYHTELVNSFDNSILSTDDMIAEVIGRIRALDVPGAVLYISDHGEDLMDDRRGRFLHASPLPTFYQLHVPYLIWFSPQYRERYPDRYRNAVSHAGDPLSSNSVFHTMLDMASIRTPYLDSTLSVVSPRLLTGPRTYLNDHDGCDPINRMHLHKLDVAKFRETGLRYP